MIRAILRAQFLSMRWGRGSWVRLIPQMVWYAFWTAVSVIAFMGAAWAEPAMLRKYLPLAFLGVLFYWQFMPVLTVSMGRSLDLKKLSIYPVPHEKLFFVETLLCLTTTLEMLLVLTGGAAGLVARDFHTAPAVLAAALVFILLNALLASGTRSLIGRLMSKRRIREVVILTTTCLWMVPRVLMQLDIHPKWLGPFADALRGPAYPWSAAALLAMGQWWWPLLALAVWTVAAYWFGRRQFERNLRFDAAQAQAQVLTPDSSRRRRWSDAFYRLPTLLWRDPMGAIVEKELRSLARTPRFRMVFVMGFTFGILVWLPVVMGRGGTRFGSQYFMAMVCMYALTLLGQVTYWNSFGFDRSAAMFYFVAPQKISRVLIGKNIAAAIFVYLDILILGAVVSVFHLGGGFGRAAETWVVIGVCALYLFGLGNMASVNYPRALNPEKVNRGGGSGKAQGLLVLFYPLALLPVVLAYVARWALKSEIAFYVVLTLAAAIGAAVYWIGLDSAVMAAGAKREAMLGELSKGDGPMTAD